MRVQEERISYLLSRITGQISEEEYSGVLRELRRTTHEICNSVFEQSQAPPLFELYWRERCSFYAEKPWIEERARLNLALQRDITEYLHEQVDYRAMYEGNVCLEFSGPTGFGKSSTMLGFAERHNKLGDHVRSHGSQALRDRIAIDIGELPRMLPNLEARDAIMLDEQLLLVGENAKTHLALLRNMEETLRGTMIDLHYASPTTRDHATSQGVLVAISNSPAHHTDGTKGRLSTTYLYYLALDGEPLPLGTVTLPWCSPEVFRAYKDFKMENLERTKRMQFHSITAVTEATLEKLFEDERLAARVRAKRSLNKSDWARYIRAYGHSMSIAEVENTASELDEMVSIIKSGEDRYFRKIWGFDPPQAMVDVVKPKPSRREVEA